MGKTVKPNKTAAVETEASGPEALEGWGAFWGFRVPVGGSKTTAVSGFGALGWHLGPRWKGVRALGFRSLGLGLFF